jgi:hypothetical protein
LFRDGWKKRWLLLEAEKLFLFRSESELEHLEFIDLSAVHKVAPVENAFGTSLRDQFGFTIESSAGKHFFLADDHKAMWFWVTGIVKWVNHIARSYKGRTATNRVDLSDIQASRDAAEKDGKIELSHAVVKQLMRASGAEVGAPSPNLPPGKFIRSKSVNLRRSLGPDELPKSSKGDATSASPAPAPAPTPPTTPAAAVATPSKGVRFSEPAATPAATPTTDVLKAGPIETVMLRPKNETKLNESEADAAVEAMREKIEHILSGGERINLGEARAILLAARAVDEEHNPGARTPASAKSSLNSSSASAVTSDGAESDDSNNDAGSDVAKLQARLEAAERRVHAAEQKAIEGERRRTIVGRTWNERVVEMRRELELVAKAREQDTARWRRRTFDALLLAHAQPADADALFQRLLTEVSPEADVSEWHEWIAKNE